MMYASYFTKHSLSPFAVSDQVFVLDPASEDGKELVEYVKLFLDHLVPARFGLLLVPQETSEVGVALCRGFSYLSVHETPRQALKWLYKVMMVLTVYGSIWDFKFCYLRFRVHL